MKACARQMAFFAPLVLLATAGLKAQSSAAAAEACASATLNGVYGYLLQGNLLEQGSLAPYADMGSLTADGKGNFSGSGTETLAGTIASGTTLSGTYSINTDCTGSASLTYSNGIGTFHFNLIVLSNGEGITFMQTDSGSIVSGTGRLQETGCVPGSLDGSYAFTINGTLLDSLGNLNPYTDSGKISFDGAGKLTVNDTISASGSITPNRSISGTYTTHSNCTGTVTFTDPNLGNLQMNIAILSGSQQIRLIDTDSGTILAGSATVLGDVAAEGVMAHVATGGGWLTTFTLSNTGTSPANISLAFFGDNGEPLSLPLQVVDSGAISTTSTLTETIEPGATLVVATHPQSGAVLVTGSAVLTSQGGNAGGFAVFHYNPNAQEAVVPLETRNAAAYILAFDNTNGLSTGVAVANVSNQSVKIPLTVRDDTGAQLGTATIPLAAHGHTSFILSYGFAKNKRGTVEVDAPSGAEISALAIRGAPTGSFTTIPALVK